MLLSVNVINMCQQTNTSLLTNKVSRVVRTESISEICREPNEEEKKHYKNKESVPLTYVDLLAVSSLMKIRWMRNEGERERDRFMQKELKCCKEGKVRMCYCRPLGETSLMLYWLDCTQRNTCCSDLHPASSLSRLKRADVRSFTQWERVFAPQIT